MSLSYEVAVVCLRQILLFKQDHELLVSHSLNSHAQPLPFIRPNNV